MPQSNRKGVIREPGNFLTHFIPAILSLPAVYLLWLQASTPKSVLAALIYGVFMSMLFSVSAIYHSVPKTESTIRLWQKMDHCCIYLMIAGSFTPTAMLFFKEPVGSILLGLVWLIATVGCSLKMLNRLQNSALSTAVYIAMGCLIIPFGHQLLTQMPLRAILWLLGGGFFYISGTYFYAKDTSINRYFHSHEIWHLFVNMGAFCHLMYNYFYVFAEGK